MKKLYFFLLCLLLLQSCVEPYELKEKIDLNVININGIFSNLPEENYVSLTDVNAITNGSGKPYYTPIDNAMVTIVGSDGTIVNFKSFGPKTEYYLPTQPIIAKQGVTYQLKVVLANGIEFISKKEKLPQETTLSKVNTKLETYEDALGTRANHTLNVDFNDFEKNIDYYKWIFSIVEKKQICKTCIDNRKYRGGQCIYQYTFPLVAFYDYYCSTSCYEIRNFDPQTTFSDIYSNGKPTLGLSIGKFPFYEFSPVLVSMKQLSINYAAYSYNQTLKSVGKNTGTLADTPPVALISNVAGVDKNSSIVVGGYVYFTHISKQNLLITRENSAGIVPEKLIGRSIVQESGPFSVFDAPCYEDWTTTNKKPVDYPN